MMRINERMPYEAPEAEEVKLVERWNILTDPSQLDQNDPGIEDDYGFFD